MTYILDFTDGTKESISVVNASVETSTNLGFTGRGYKNYGEVQAENLLHLLENFASGSAPSKPVEGQLWYDSGSNQLKYFDDTVINAGNWKSIASMTVQSVAPIGAGENEGHFWLDSDTGLLHLYYNGSWIAINDAAGDTRVVARTRYDTGNATHRTIETIVNGQIVTIVSSDLVMWQPQNSGPNTEYLENGTTLLNTQFQQLSRGVNLNQGTGYFYTGTATTALYADLAERYHSDRVYAYGTVMKLGGTREITATTDAYCTQVFGVISEKPGYGMNSGAGDDKTHPYIALAGRVPVRVIGKVTKGDRLVASNQSGYAMADNSVLDWRCVIGRALEDKINVEMGTIEVAVGVK